MTTGSGFSYVRIEKEDLMKNLSKLLFNGDINYIYDYDRKQHNQYYILCPH